MILLQGSLLKYPLPSARGQPQRPMSKEHFWKYSLCVLEYNAFKSFLPLNVWIVTASVNWRICLNVFSLTFENVEMNWMYAKNIWVIKISWWENFLEIQQMVKCNAMCFFGVMKKMHIQKIANATCAIIAYKLGYPSQFI